MSEAIDPALDELAIEHEAELNDWLGLLMDRAVIETVRSCYLREAVVLEDEYGDGLGEDEYKERYWQLYTVALLDFGFAQARGRALGYLSLFLKDTPLSVAPAGKAIGELDDLRRQARDLGIPEEEYRQIRRLATQEMETTNWEFHHASVLEWSEAEYQRARYLAAWHS